MPVDLFFVVCYCFLFWIGCVSSNSAIMKSDHFVLSLQTEYCGVRKHINI